MGLVTPVIVSLFGIVAFFYVGIWFLCPVMSVIGTAVFLVQHPITIHNFR